jgi:hypothetical protein
MQIYNTTAHLSEYLQSFPSIKIYTEQDKLKAKINSRIFFINNEKENRICVRLCTMDAEAFTQYNNELIHPVPKKWGSSFGWTLVYYKQLPIDVVQEIITASFCYMAKPAIANMVRDAAYNTWNIEHDNALRKSKSSR